MIYMNISHWFLPHKDTHQKATLISWEGMVIYILLFMLLQVSFHIAGFLSPGILGTSSNITQAQIIELTNKEREKVGLAPLVANTALDTAAKDKAANIFSENYWAHFAPSGKTPWDFILGSGYKFSFAGENLAKNFYSPDEVVKAWMDSSTHKENLLNPRYKDIGIAVEDGILNGQKTTLVVQMFGTTTAFANIPTVKVAGQNLTVSKQEYESTPALVASVQSNFTIKPLMDPYIITKSFGTAVVVLVAALLILDFIVIKRRGVYRISSHHWGHMTFLAASALLILKSSPGSIL